MSQTLEETERLSKIVRQLMELTQLDSGEIELEREWFDLSELVATTTEQMKLLAEDKEIRFEAEPRASSFLLRRPLSHQAGSSEPHR